MEWFRVWVFGSGFTGRAWNLGRSAEMGAEYLNSLMIYKYFCALLI